MADKPLTSQSDGNVPTTRYGREAGRSAEQAVLDALHAHTDLCVAADTCAAREIIAPLVAEVRRLQTLVDEWVPDEDVDYPERRCGG